MKTNPIIFSSPMVRAILDGRKTQTRRIVKDKLPWCLDPAGFYALDFDQRDGFAEPAVFHKDGRWFWYEAEYPDEGGMEFRCPFGQPGDLLWVRERFRAERPFTGDIDHDLTTSTIRYYADDHPKYRDQDKWKPSIHMPRWASRITLEVEAVRVERLQDIGERDAVAEGSEGPRPTLEWGEISETGPPTFVHGFAETWEAVNGAGSWDENPYVWVLDFKRLVG